MSFFIWFLSHFPNIKKKKILKHFLKYKSGTEKRKAFGLLKKGLKKKKLFGQILENGFTKYYPIHLHRELLNAYYLTFLLDKYYFSPIISFIIIFGFFYFIFFIPTVIL